MFTWLKNYLATREVHRLLRETRAREDAHAQRMREADYFRILYPNNPERDVLTIRNDPAGDALKFCEASARNGAIILPFKLYGEGKIGIPMTNGYADLNPPTHTQLRG